MIEISGSNPNHKIQLRWSKVFGSFFGKVIDRRIESGIESGLINGTQVSPVLLQVGTRQREILTIGQLQSVLSEFVILDLEAIAQLKHEYDQANQLTPQQQQFRQQYLNAISTPPPASTPNLPSLERLSAMVDYAGIQQLLPYDDGRKWVVLQNPDLTLAEVGRTFLDETAIEQVKTWVEQGDIVICPSVQFIGGKHFDVLFFVDAYFLKPNLDMEEQDQNDELEDEFS